MERKSKSINSIFPTPIPHLHLQSAISHEDKNSLSSTQLLTSMMKSDHYAWNSETDQERLLARLAPSGESQIQVIEWNMMNKWKFYPLSMVSSFTIRCLLYPFTLVKTKMQVGFPFMRMVYGHKHLF